MVEFLKKHYAVIAKLLWLCVIVVATLVSCVAVNAFNIGTSYANAMRDKSAIEEDIAGLKDWRTATNDRQEIVERKLIRMDGNIELLMRAMDVKPLPKESGAP